MSEATGKLSKSAIGRLAIKDVPVCSRENKVETIKAEVLSKASNFETINYIYVVNKNNCLKGVISLKELLQANESRVVEKIMITKLITLRAGSHKEKAALAALEHNLKALPVVDKKGKFLGVVPSDTLLEILYEKANQDFFNFSGRKMAVEKEPVLKQVRLRLPWILIGLLGGVISSRIIYGFEETLLKMVMLAAFIPVILSLSGNVAIQSAVVFVREISYGKIDRLFKAVMHEILMGIIIGLISGVLLAGIAMIMHKSAILGVIVGISIAITQTVAAMLGLLIPWIFKALGKDPAMGSGPMVTTLMDIVVVSVYLSIAWMMLN